MNYSETLKTLEDIVREVGEKHFTNVKDFTCSEKQDGSLVTEIDISVDASLSKKLKEVFPSVLFISEESQSDVAQTQGLVWCIDPIDGTHNFVNNIQYFAVSVGLLLNGAPLLGVIYDPTSGDILSGGSGIGVFLNKEDMLIENTSNIIVSGRLYQ